MNSALIPSASWVKCSQESSCTGTTTAFGKIRCAASKAISLERVIKAPPIHGGALQGMDVALLTTVGARSGLERTSPVSYLSIDGERYLVAANIGQPNKTSQPDWSYNLRANPAARLEFQGETFLVVALELEGEDHRHIRGRFAEVVHGGEENVPKTSRPHTPIFRITRDE